MCLNFACIEREAPYYYLLVLFINCAGVQAGEQPACVSLDIIIYNVEKKIGPTKK